MHKSVVFCRFLHNFDVFSKFVQREPVLVVPGLSTGEHGPEAPRQCCSTPMPLTWCSEAVRACQVAAGDTKS